MEIVAEKRQFSSIIAGGTQQYQNFRKTMEMSPSIYKHDFQTFNDYVDNRHNRNINELKQIIKLIQSGKFTDDMLFTNTLNSFYPSYVLHHHYSVFSKLIKQCPKHPFIKQLIEQTRNIKSIGAYFQQMINYQKTVTKVNYVPKISKSGYIVMDQDTYFFSAQSSLLIHYCCFLIQGDGQTGLCFMKLRNQNGQIANNIKIKDAGAILTQDYLPVAYNFNNCKPQLVVKIKNQISNTLTFVKSQTMLDQFRLSLLDLRKSLAITIKYTSMRRQFKTVDGSKQERLIISYQAVSSRILDAYVNLTAFSFLTVRLKSIPTLSIFFVPLLQYSHHLIFQQLIKLRQCCGGFGYLQVSGHPSGIERTGYRASHKSQAQIPNHKQFLKRAHYYSGDDSLEPFFGEKIVIQNMYSFSELWKVFVIICVNMRKRQNQIPKDEYIREFVKQSAIQAVYNFDSFSKVKKIDNTAEHLMYMISSYILQHGKYINWSYVKTQPEVFFENVHAFHRKLTIQLSKRMNQLYELLQMDYIRNAIQGRDNSEQFYTEVFKVSKQNYRNSDEFRKYVTQPIVDMINQNRNARL